MVLSIIESTAHHEMISEDQSCKMLCVFECFGISSLMPFFLVVQ